MKYAKVEDFQDRPNPHGVSAKTIYDNPEAQLVHILLRPGESLKKHVTPVDAAFYVLEGEGEVEIGDETVHIVKDTIVESPANIPHRLLNNGTSDFRFLVLKAPKPVQRSALL